MPSRSWNATVASRSRTVRTRWSREAIRALADVVGDRRCRERRGKGRLGRSQRWTFAKTRGVELARHVVQAEERDDSVERRPSNSTVARSPSTKVAHGNVPPRPARCSQRDVDGGDGGTRSRATPSRRALRRSRARARASPRQGESRVEPSWAESPGSVPPIREAVGDLVVAPCDDALTPAPPPRPRRPPRAPRPRRARAPRGSCRRWRSRSRGGRRRGARGGSSRPRRGTCRPARRPASASTRSSGPIARHAAGRQRPGLGGQEADRERLPEARQHELVRQLLAERHPQLHLDQVDADRVAHEVGHLPAGDPRRALDHDHAAVGRRDQLRERDPGLAARARAPSARRPARTPRAGRRRPSPGRGGSSRRRSRSRAGAAGRRASA